jgi:PhoH-like ATPase
MQKYFLLDTNVLIHNPQSLYSFADNFVVIPITVIEELDRFKSSADKKGMHARQVLREIDSLVTHGALKKGAKMSNGGTLIISLEYEHMDIPNLDDEVNDNRILNVAYKMQLDGKQVYFVSKDVNARIKAEALGINARDYENQKVEYQSLYRGWREITVSSEDVQTLLDQGKLYINEEFNPNEYALVRSEGDDPEALAKYNEASGCLMLLNPKCKAMGITPLNVEQRFAFDLLLDDNIKLVTVVGQAGSGKTLMAIACALSKIVIKDPVYEKLLIVRPIVPLGKDIGYLPGSKEKKLNYWMQPIYDNMDFILKRTTSGHNNNDGIPASELTLESLTRSEILEIDALTYIRGRSIPDQFFIVDEAQNLTPHEIKTIISRAGNGTKIILTGDPNQIDNPYLDANSNGLTYAVDRLKHNKIVGHILLSKSERSELASLAVEQL